MEMSAIQKVIPLGSIPDKLSKFQDVDLAKRYALFCKQNKKLHKKDTVKLKRNPKHVTTPENKVTLLSFPIEKTPSGLSRPQQTHPTPVCSPMSPVSPAVPPITDVDSLTSHHGSRPKNSAPQMDVTQNPSAKHNVNPGKVSLVPSLIKKDEVIQEADCEDAQSHGAPDAHDAPIEGPTPRAKKVQDSLETAKESAAQRADAAAP
jgi:hypothetical protein